MNLASILLMWWYSFVDDPQRHAIVLHLPNLYTYCFAAILFGDQQTHPRHIGCIDPFTDILNVAQGKIKKSILEGRKVLFVGPLIPLRYLAFSVETRPTLGDPLTFSSSGRTRDSDSNRPSYRFNIIYICTPTSSWTKKPVPVAQFVKALGSEN